MHTHTPSSRALLSDRTIIALSIVYAVGNIFVSLSAIPTIYSVEAQRLIGERWEGLYE